jgi:hypothetical protein
MQHRSMTTPIVWAQIRVLRPNPHESRRIHGHFAVRPVADDGGEVGNHLLDPVV